MNASCPELYPGPRGGMLRRGNPRPGGWPGAGRRPTKAWMQAVRAARAAYSRGWISIDTFQRIVADAFDECRGSKAGSRHLANWILDRGLDGRWPACFTGEELSAAADRLIELVEGRETT